MQLLLTMLNTAFTWILNNIGSVATIAIALLTYSYVRATKAMVVEMKEARKEQQRPYIIVDFDIRDWFLCDIVIKNIGNGAARQIKIKFDPDVVYHGSTAKLSELPIFKEGITFLPPNKEIKFLFGVGHELLKEGNPRCFNVCLEYGDIFRNLYNETIVLDLSIYEKLTHVGEKGIPALHKELEGIRGNLEKAVCKIETIANVFEEGLRFMNYEFAVVSKQGDAKEILKGKLEECVNVWNSIHYENGPINRNKLYTLRLLGYAIISLVSNCSQLDSEQKGRILEIAHKTEELNNLLRVMGRYDEFQRSGEELVIRCKETLSLLEDVK